MIKVGVVGFVIFGVNLSIVSVLTVCKPRSLYVNLNPVNFEYGGR